MSISRRTFGFKRSISVQLMKTWGLSQSDIGTIAHSCAIKSQVHCLYCDSAYLPKYNTGDACFGFSVWSKLFRNAT